MIDIAPSTATPPLDVADDAWDKTSFSTLPGAKEWAGEAPARALLKRIECRIAECEQDLAKAQCSHCAHVSDGNLENLGYLRGLKSAFVAFREILVEAQKAEPAERPTVLSPAEKTEAT